MEKKGGVTGVDFGSTGRGEEERKHGGRTASKERCDRVLEGHEES